MKTPRTTPATNTFNPAAPKTSGFGGAWLRFWFTPTDPISLHALRVLAGLVFLLWLLPLAGHVNSLFGASGWFDLQTHADIARFEGTATGVGDDSPLPFGWSVLHWLGSQSGLVTAVYWSAVLVVLLLTLGIATRVTSVLTWVAMVSFTANPVLESDGDVLVRLLALYLMLGYVLLDQFSPGLSLRSRLLGSRDTWLLGASPARPSIGANVALRLLQVHVVVVVLTSAMHKLQFGEWWTGFALWYPFHSHSTLQDVRRLTPDGNFYLNMYSLATYLVLAWQLAFPFFAWRPRWRSLLFGGAALAWFANASLYQVPLFGPAFAMCCLSFVTPAEWRRLLARVSRLPGLAVFARWVPPENDAPVETKGRKKATASPLTTGQR